MDDMVETIVPVGAESVASSLAYSSVMARDLYSLAAAYSGEYRIG